MNNMNDNSLSPSQKPTPLRYAMSFGLIVGGMMSLQFLLSLIWGRGLLAQVISLALLIATPVVMVRLAIIVRRSVYGDIMSYGQAFRYLTLQLLLALIPFTLAAYIGFTWLKGTPAGAAVMQQGLELWSELAKEDPSLVEGLELVRKVSPWDMTWQTITMTLFLGLLFNYLAALLVRRTPKNLA